ARGEVPDVNAAVLAGRGQLVPVRTVDDIQQAAWRSALFFLGYFEQCQLLTLGAPEPHQPVGADAGTFASLGVRATGVDVGGMGRQLGSDFSPGAQVPPDQCALVVAGEEAAPGARGATGFDGQGQEGCAGGQLPLLPGLGPVPATDHAVQAHGNHFVWPIG